MIRNNFKRNCASTMAYGLGYVLPRYFHSLMRLANCVRVVFALQIIVGPPRSLEKRELTRRVETALKKQIKMLLVM